MDVDVNRRKRGERKNKEVYAEEFGRREDKKRGRRPKFELMDDDDDFRKGRFSEGELNFDELDFEIKDWDE